MLIDHREPVKEKVTIKCLQGFVYSEHELCAVVVVLL